MRSRASSHRGERAEDTSSASSLVEVELVERNGHSGEDAVARYTIGFEPRKSEKKLLIKVPRLSAAWEQG